MARLAIVTGILFGFAASLPAEAQVAAPQPGSSTRLSQSDCSATYHAALETVRTGRGAALGGLYRALRATDPDLPGKWQITAPAAGKPKPAPKPERVCVETKDIPGRSPRCVRFELKAPVLPPDVTAKLPITPEEARILKQFGDFIEAKGALPDVGPNGRYNFMVQRVAQDIRVYATQPAHPNLCAGSADLIEFYNGQIAPLKRRMDELNMAVAQLKDMAALRVRNIAVAELKNYNKAVAEVAKVEAARQSLLNAHAAAVSKAAALAAARPADGPVPPPIAEPVLPPALPAPPQPNAPAELADFAVISLPALIREALRPLLAAERIAQITDEPSLPKQFVRARGLLLDPSTATSTAATEVKDMALLALRFLEARAYADAYVSRFKELDAALFGAMADLKAAQVKSCTCRE